MITFDPPGHPHLRLVCHVSPAGPVRVPLTDQMRQDNLDVCLRCKRCDGYKSPEQFADVAVCPQNRFPYSLIPRHATPIRRSELPDIPGAMVIAIDELAWAKQMQGNDRCIMTGCDAGQEGLLPGWYGHVRQHSDLPILFADHGMSAVGKAWCAARGTVIDAKYSVDHPLMAKPIAILQSTYAFTLWLDPDTRVIAPLERHFEAIGEKEIALARDHCPPTIQCGVMVVRHESAVMLETARLCLIGFANGLSRIALGDQDAMNHIRERDGEAAFAILPDTFNCLIGYHNPASASVLHYAGQEKRHLARVPMVTEDPAPPVLPVAEVTPVDEIALPTIEHQVSFQSPRRKRDRKFPATNLSANFTETL